MRRPSNRLSRLVASTIPVVFSLVLAAACGSGGDKLTADSSTSTGSSTSVESSTSTALSTSTSTSTSAETTTTPPRTAPATVPPTPTPTAPVTVPSSAVSDDGSVIATFLSPSRNIACQLFVLGNDGEARCDIRSATFTPPRPAEPCDLDYGDSIVLTTYAEFGCHGDTVFDPSAQVLGYGQRMDVGPFRCDSERVGVTCTNLSTGRGFSIRRASYRLF